MYAPGIAPRSFRMTVRTRAASLWVLIIGTAAGLLVSGCQPSRPPTGTIKGTIELQGPPPRIEPLAITKDQDVCKNVPNESLIVSAGGGVQNAVVALEGAPAAAESGKSAEHPVFRLTNSECRFVPHVLVMQFDEPLEISNVDPILHTARTLRSQVNVGLYPGRAVRKDIGAPLLGPAKITCEIHPWMAAYVYLTDNPYYAVTDLHGEYEIDQVPPGKYRVAIWHELLGKQIENIEVTAGKATELNFSFPSAQASPH